jgi:hypothetical protein
LHDLFVFRPQQLHLKLNDVHLCVYGVHERLPVDGKRFQPWRNSSPTISGFRFFVRFLAAFLVEELGSSVRLLRHKLLPFVLGRSHISVRLAFRASRGEGSRGICNGEFAGVVRRSPAHPAQRNRAAIRAVTPGHKRAMSVRFVPGIHLRPTSPQSFWMAAVLPPLFATNGSLQVRWSAAAWKEVH